MALEAYKSVTQEEIILQQLRSREKALNDYYSGLKGAEERGRIKGEKIGREKGKKVWLKKGEKVGIEKGEKLGLKKGEKVGIEKGEKVGIEKAKRETAKAMKEKGIDLKIIAEVTKLSIKVIEKL